MKRSSDGAEADAGEPDDPPDGVGVDDEVLAHCLVGRRPSRAARSWTRAAPRNSGESVIPELLDVLQALGQGLQPQGWRPDLA